MKIYPAANRIVLTGRYSEIKKKLAAMQKEQATVSGWLDAFSLHSKRKPPL